MIISGIQKMTLLDYPEHVACTVFFGGCDFKCPYCHNYELVSQNSVSAISENDFFDFLSKRKNILDGVAITGGEPLLQPELKPFLQKIKDMGFLIKLDTNGYHPDALQKLISKRLVDYIAMDIKNSPENYSETVQLSTLKMETIKRSIELITGSGIPYEFRTTVVKEFHSEKDFEAIGEMIQGARAYYLQPFVDRDTVPYKNLTTPSEKELEKYLEIVKKWVPAASIRGI